jgi:hypothetical protein
MQFAKVTLSSVIESLRRGKDDMYSFWHPILRNCMPLKKSVDFELKGATKSE